MAETNKMGQEVARKSAWVKNSLHHHRGCSRDGQHGWEKRAGTEGGGSDRPCNSLSVLKHWSYLHVNNFLRPPTVRTLRSVTFLFFLDLSSIDFVIFFFQSESLQSFLTKRIRSTGQLHSGAHRPPINQSNFPPFTHFFYFLNRKARPCEELSHCEIWSCSPPLFRGAHSSPTSQACLALQRSCKIQFVCLEITPIPFATEH